MLHRLDCIVFLTDSLQNFDKHTQDFYNSADFKKKSDEAQPFFKSVKDYVFGRPANLENIVRWFPVSPLTND
jgi:hypothetical protein